MFESSADRSTPPTYCFSNDLSSQHHRCNWLAKTPKHERRLRGNLHALQLLTLKDQEVLFDWHHPTRPLSRRQVIAAGASTPLACKYMRGRLAWAVSNVRQNGDVVNQPSSALSPWRPAMLARVKQLTKTPFVWQALHLRPKPALVCTPPPPGGPPSLVGLVLLLCISACWIDCAVRTCRVWRSR